MVAVVVTDETTKAELAEALANMLHRAKREMPRVGTVEHPTPWDKRHAAMDALLEDWVKAPG